MVRVVGNLPEGERGLSADACKPERGVDFEIDGFSGGFLCGEPCPEF